jgi:hypothetical protein
MRMLAFALASLLGTSSSALGQSAFAGTWQADLAQTWTAVLRVDGDRLTGNVSSCNSLPVPIIDGSIN